MEGQPWVHPDSVGIDTLHAMKVLSLDLASGSILWERTAYEGTVFDHRHKRGSYAAPTMVTDGSMVVAYFGPEGLYEDASRAIGRLLHGVDEDLVQRLMRRLGPFYPA